MVRISPRAKRTDGPSENGSKRFLSKNGFLFLPAVTRGIFSATAVALSAANSCFSTIFGRKMRAIAPSEENSVKGQHQGLRLRVVGQYQGLRLESQYQGLRVRVTGTKAAMPAFVSHLNKHKSTENRKKTDSYTFCDGGSGAAGKTVIGRFRANQLVYHRFAADVSEQGKKPIRTRKKAISDQMHSAENAQKMIRVKPAAPRDGEARGR